MQFLTSNCKITKVKDHSAAGTSDVVSDIIDMQGYEGVVFITSLGTAASGNYIVCQGNTVNSTGGMADLASTKITSGTSDEDLVEDLLHPQFRYIQATVTRGTSSTCESIWAIQYGARRLPPTNTISGTLIQEQHEGSIAGTA